MPTRERFTFETALHSYRTIELLGEGGSGTVYKAEDEDGKLFAIKRLDPQKLSRDKLKRFENELRFCQRNTHQNIVTVTDHGAISIQGNKCPFYVMHYYAETLRTIMKKGLQTDKIMVYFSALLDGVEAAHLKKIWHRDLKPENILCDPSQDTLVVADFGIAHFAEEELYTLVETRPHVRLANFLYAAPEQRMRGNPVDHRADIYAVGLILNEMFTGEVLQGTGYKRISAIAQQFSYLDEVVEAMVQQSPSARPESLDVIKRMLIARRDEYVSRQKLNQLGNDVIRSSEIDDPLINDPVRVVDVEFDRGMLKFKLSRTVNPLWTQAFQDPGSYTFLVGYEPQRFDIRGNVAAIPAEERLVERLLENFKNYVSSANRLYKARVEEVHRQREAKERVRLQREREEAELSIRVRERLRKMLA
jgi:serine/threonine protein kinase